MMRLFSGGREEFLEFRRGANCVAMLVNFSASEIVFFWGLGALLQCPRSLWVACKSVNEDNASAG